MTYEAGQRLREIFADVLQTDIDPMGELDLKDVESWDSISHMHLIMDLEQSFGLTISDDEVIRLTSLARIRELLDERGGEVL